MVQKERLLAETGDMAAISITLGAVIEIAPTILVLLGCLWFLLRFVNAFRVLVLKKESWKLGSW